jgi:nucleotide-binding universal stress UspA family protein
LTLLHVIEAVDGVPFEELADFYGDLERRALATLDRFSRPLRDAGLVVEGRVCYGKRAREIIRYANENAFDLMVLGSHRLTPENFDSGFMTISHQVAIAARIPVLVVKR